MATPVKVQVSKLTLSKLLMAATIVLIAAFQFYWVTRLYNEESDALKKQTDVLFKDAMYKLQLQRFRSDVTFIKGHLPDNLFLFDAIDSVRTKLVDRVPGHGLPGTPAKITISVQRDSGLLPLPDTIGKKMESLSIVDSSIDGASHIVRYFSNNKILTKPLSVAQIDSGYKKELEKNNISIPFTILTQEQAGKNSMPPPGLTTELISVGLSRHEGYLARFQSPVPYLLNKIKLPVVASLLLIVITILSFVFLYRNLREQQRLAAIKNEFISNITHELKTPIATVNVAVEALRNFNALQNPERTKEYLDISALELQRLSMLVDKVLKLSMFENREIELNMEKIDLHQLAAQVIAGMKLQFEKANAVVQLTKEGDDFTVMADKLHITSVLYNLLDNALKYSTEKPAITIHLSHEGPFVTVAVSDNGIGIPAAYIHKIFDKFFRVPSGNHHNIKGYGLGLSYVHHIIMQHGGLVTVNSTEGRGSTFTIKLSPVAVKTTTL